VQHDRAHHLHVEVPLADRAPRRLPDAGEGLGQEIVEGLPVRQAAPERLGLARELVSVGFIGLQFDSFPHAN